MMKHLFEAVLNCLGYVLVNGIAASCAPCLYGDLSWGVPCGCMRCNTVGRTQVCRGHCTRPDQEKGSQSLGMAWSL